MKSYLKLSLIVSTVVGVFFASLLSLGAHAQEVTLIEALGPNEDPILNNAKEISQDIFFTLEQESLGLLSPNHERRRSFGQVPQYQLSEADQLIVLETVIQRMGKRVAGRLLGNPYWIREIQAELYDSSVQRMEKILDALEQELKTPEEFSHRVNEADSLIFGEKVNSVFREMKNIPILIGLLLRLEQLAQSDANKWEKVLNRAYETARNEFIRLDYQIKIIKQINPEAAEKMAAASISTVLGSQHEMEVKVFTRLFNGIEGDFSLNVDAHRYIALSIDWVMAKLATPVKRWSFRIALTASIIAGVTGFTGPEALSDGAAYAAAVTGPTWLGLFIADLYKGAFVGVGILLDKVVNLISRPFSQNREGSMTQALGKARVLSCGRVLADDL